MNALKARLRSVMRQHLHTANTIRYRVEWPRIRGVFLPVAWVDAETFRSEEERRACEPFGILMLFEKTA